MPVEDQIAARLIQWFQVNARPLPWRMLSDPYPIWISEVMLQQTQVQTVIPFWTRWMKELPDVRALAEAPLDRVLKLWEGLGYYSRARNLHRAAQEIVQRHGGEFPLDSAGMLALPGIGAYTAGAVCSIAYDQPAPILDGNVIRVLCRVYGLTGNPRITAVNRDLWQRSAALVNAADALRARVHRPCGSLNQSLMELGATVCRPKEAACPSCPLADLCAGRADGAPERLPNLGSRSPSTRRHFAAFVFRRHGKYLVRRRPAGAVNGGLWEFPNVELQTPRACPETLAQPWCGQKPDSFRLLCTVRHTITRYRIRLDAYEAILKAPAVSLQDGSEWKTLKQLDRLAFPSAHRKLVVALQKGGGRQRGDPRPKAHGGRPGAGVRAREELEPPSGLVLY